ncbi:hypothetical protein SAMN02745148_00748 [Modicisalibacter ilicicola DSM 19980]|uniref:Outer membrane protein n=1 Tax=Modicisalibacter ilicicola DSM 19980 TaxID=1121942 RepID=A0A1M4UT99_9GAMM|nr:hypothetical protein [Halomonas ilicicola]SHE59820.1 hypothetical protein SAMN02745148_00748 [Halomonas ilicicola DSM 19980]
MKKLARITFIGTALILGATHANADALGVTARLNGAYSDWEYHDRESDNGFQGDLSLRFEHPIPLLPNIAVGAEHKNQDFPGEGNSLNAEFYYELIDVLGASLDAGLGFERWEMDADGIDDSDNAYANARAHFRLPISALGVEAEIKQNLDGDSVEHDRWRAGLTYDLVDLIAASTTVALGYQDETMEIEGNEWESKGAYLGLEIDF